MAETPALLWRTTLKRRLLVSILLLGGWAVSIEARLVYLQVISHADLSARAERQQVSTIETTAKRGDILDRNGNVLAFSVEADSICVHGDSPGAVGMAREVRALLERSGVTIASFVDAGAPQ